MKQHHQLCNIAVAAVIIQLLAVVVSLCRADDIACDPAVSINPCTCSDANDGVGTVTLDCTGQGLDDDAIDDILSLLTSNTTLLLSRLLLANNTLTRVPHHIRSSTFQHLNYVQLDGNMIDTIDTGAFNFQTSTLLGLFVRNNRLQTIDPGAFQGMDGCYASANMQLSFNNLTRFEASVYQSVLEQMVEQQQSSSVLFVNDNPFDCQSDPCLMAWLVRDNRHLLPVVASGKCSNGTLFEQLNVDDYADCAAEVTTTTTTTTTTIDTTTTESVDDATTTVTTTTTTTANNESTVSAEATTTSQDNSSSTDVFTTVEVTTTTTTTIEEMTSSSLLANTTNDATLSTSDATSTGTSTEYQLSSTVSETIPTSSSPSSTTAESITTLVSTSSTVITTITTDESTMNTGDAAVTATTTTDGPGQQQPDDNDDVLDYLQTQLIIVASVLGSVLLILIALVIYISIAIKKLINS